MNVYYYNKNVRFEEQIWQKSKKNAFVLLHNANKVKYVQINLTVVQNEIQNDTKVYEKSFLGQQNTMKDEKSILCVQENGSWIIKDIDDICKKTFQNIENFVVKESFLLKDEEDIEMIKMKKTKELIEECKNLLKKQIEKNTEYLQVLEGCSK